MEVKQPRQGRTGGLSGLTAEGAILAGARTETFTAAHASVIAVQEANSSPLFPGTIAEFMRMRTNDEALQLQMRNVVLKCAICGKANGLTLRECNGCNTAFPPEQARTHTENVFMGFVYGVAKTDAFPLSTSIRQQTSDDLVFDAPLALSACHLNCIPTSSWVPDWRLLLRNPAEGLRLLELLEEALWSCVASQFLSSETWYSSHSRHPTAPLSQRRAPRVTHEFPGEREVVDGMVPQSRPSTARSPPLT